MFKETFVNIDNYLKEKYENYCKEILTEQINEKYNKMEFNTVWDKLLFVNLFENEHYYDVIEEVKQLIYGKISKLSINEIEFLFLKCLDKFIDYQQYYDSKLSLNIKSKVKYISYELIHLIEETVETQLTDVGNKVDKFLKQIRENICNFLYTGTLVEDNDVEFDNFWEEFCYHVNLDKDYVLDVFLKDIKELVYISLNNLPLKDIILLYTQTDYFIYFECEHTPRTSDEMIYCLIPKLLNDIKEMAWLSDISYLKT